MSLIHAIGQKVLDSLIKFNNIVMSKYPVALAT